MTAATTPTATANARPDSLGDRVKRGVDRWLLPVYVLFVTLYLVLPVAIMILFSFNDPAGRSNLAWGSFSIDAWLNPLGRPGLPDAVANSLIIAFVATIVSTILGTMIGLALVRYSFRGRSATNLLIFLPMSTPEIVLGASLLTTFIATTDLDFIPEGVVYPLSIRTIIIAHIMFCISFVVVTVKARTAGVPAPPRGGRDGPRRQRVGDLLEGDLPADPAGHHGRGAAGVQPLDRRLRHHQLHGRPDPDLPAVHLRVAVARHPGPGQRHRHDHLRRRRRPGRHDDPLATPRRGARISSRRRLTVARPGGRSRWSTPPTPRRRKANAPLPDHAVVPGVWGRITNLDVDRGEGSWLITRDGERYLDYSSGIGVTNTGHAHPRVAAAVAAQAAKLLHGQQNILYHEPGLRLYERLRGVLPGGPWQAFLSNSGAEAVEASVKLARVATGRPAILAFRYGYHGRTAQTMALTSAKDVYRAAFEPLPGSVYHTAYPYCYRAPGGAHSPDACTCDWEAQLDLTFHQFIYPDRVAAVIIEPVLGEGGYIVPPPGFLPRLREITREHGILLIADEVQTGFGRTGEMFAVQHWGVEPDILVMAKGIASGLPLSGILARAI